MNKYQILDYMTVKVDEIVEARGVAKCAIAVDLVQRIDALRTILKGEDANEDQAE